MSEERISSSEPAPTVFVVDDTEANQRLLGRVFRGSGFRVHAAESGEAALAALDSVDPDLVVLDLHMPGLGGIETLRRLKRARPDLPVMMLTGDGDIPTAVEAMKLGASDFLTRPVENEALVLTARQALDHQRLVAEVRGLRRLVGGPLAKLMGSSGVISRLAEQVARVADTNVTVLVLGETGTGKELVARAIHEQSARRAGPFVALDCGAIPETLMESELFGHEKGAFSGAERRREGHLQLARGGTLLLDEVGNLSLSAQAKLLRALQERKVLAVGASAPVDVDVRFIAATNEPLEGPENARGFREDLYHRLAEFVIRIPPLRERPEDIEPLARRFLDEACTEFRRPIVAFAPEAIDALRAHPWPGNVRELRNIVRQAALQSAGPEIRPEDIRVQAGGSAGDTAIDSSHRGPASLREIADAAAALAERQAIADALREATRAKRRAVSRPTSRPCAPR